jgi:hypothetical protein
MLAAMVGEGPTSSQGTVPNCSGTEGLASSHIPVTAAILMGLRMFIQMVTVRAAYQPRPIKQR